VHKGIIGIAVVLIGLLGLTGCGGDSSTISKAEYVQQLELVCNEGLQEREEFLVKGTKESAQKKKVDSQAEAEEKKAKSIREFIAIYAGTTEEIADVGLPEQAEKKAEELVQAREDAAAKVEADPLRALSEGPKILAKANKIAEDLEVAGCAK
jgi:membrane protein involved in colicin uptake